MVRSKEEILGQIKEIIGNSTDDKAITLLEDFTDTMNDLESRSNNNEGETWKKKYEENDALWKKKYTERFFRASEDEEKDSEESFIGKKETELKTDFDELFSTKGV